MKQIISACMICGKVYKYADTTAHKTDVISHGLCGGQRCIDMVNKVMGGSALPSKCPPIWSALERK
jgi:hypothetical protein